VNPVIGELLTTISVFENGEEYLNFVEANVIPCLSSMAAAVGKDVLWKPLNHKVLMMTREKKKHERMAAVKTLYSLFNEVGEEYLLLLPECMPFLSELLEEENQDVLNLAVELVKFIEGISGESLDQYLQ
jgi:U3 small nucleolar RNA-associated protein 10